MSYHDIIAIQGMNPSKHLYITVVGNGMNQHLEVTHQGYLGRFLMMLGVSSSSLCKVAQYISERKDNFKSLYITDNCLIEKLHHYAIKHENCKGQIENLFQSLIPPSAQSNRLKATLLAKKIDALYQSYPSYTLGHFRNSHPTFQNMALALKGYADTGNLSQSIKPQHGMGQGGDNQPNTVRETFKWALDPKIHGGLQETLKAIRKSPSNNGHDKQKIGLKFAQVGREIVRFLPSVLKNG